MAIRGEARVCTHICVSVVISPTSVGMDPVITLLCNCLRVATKRAWSRRAQRKRHGRWEVSARVQRVNRSARAVRRKTRRLRGGARSCTHISVSAVISPTSVGIVPEIALLYKFLRAPQ